MRFKYFWMLGLRLMLKLKTTLVMNAGPIIHPLLATGSVDLWLALHALGHAPAVFFQLLRQVDWTGSA